MGPAGNGIGWDHGAAVESSGVCLEGFGRPRLGLQTDGRRVGVQLSTSSSSPSPSEPSSKASTAADAPAPAARRAWARPARGHRRGLAGSPLPPWLLPLRLLRLPLGLLLGLPLGLPLGLLLPGWLCRRNGPPPAVPRGDPALTKPPAEAAAPSGNNAGDSEATAAAATTEAAKVRISATSARRTARRCVARLRPRLAVTACATLLPAARELPRLLLLLLMPLLLPLLAPSLANVVAAASPCGAATAPLSQRKLAASGERRTKRSCGRPRALFGTCLHNRAAKHKRVVKRKTNIKNTSGQKLKTRAEREEGSEGSRKEGLP